MHLNRDFELAVNLLGILDYSSYKRAKELALELETTELFLRGIVTKLKKAQIVDTLSGNTGGVRRISGDITALQILIALKRKPKELKGRANQVLINIFSTLEKEKL